jgi:hypothetical protein
MPPHPISLRSISILSLSFCFPNKIVYACLLVLACYMPCPSHALWLDHYNYTWWEVKVMKLLIMQFSPISCHLNYWSKYSQRHS